MMLSSVIMDPTSTVLAILAENTCPYNPMEQRLVSLNDHCPSKVWARSITNTIFLAHSNQVGGSKSPKSHQLSANQEVPNKSDFTMNKVL